MIAPDELRVVPELAGLEEHELAWIAEHAEAMDLDPGDKPFEPGSYADNMILILRGSLELAVPKGASWQRFGTFGAGMITGLLPYSRMKTFEGRAIALEPTRLALIARQHLAEMVYRIQALGQPLIARMSDRVRFSERGRLQDEKMAALGKLSAGLAHELNNPAAAVRRSAVSVRSQMDALSGLVARLARHGLQPDQIDVAESACHLSGGDIKLSALERSEREDELADWMEDRGIDDAWELAPPLADSGMDLARLEQIMARIPQPAQADVLAWLSANLDVNRQLEDLSEAANRISELVSAIKSYTHMDRADDMQATDVRAGIESTLTMLGHKLRDRGVDIERRYSEPVPEVPAHPGELNQVWTNLIDNAIDAMPEGGTMTIEIEARSGQLLVRVIDNGTGVPDEVMDRLFEPFFTTKAVGQGTGLGLDIVHRIVSTRHGGSIDVESRPGRTAFTVRLPLGDA